MAEHDPIDRITRARLLNQSRAHIADLGLDLLEQVYLNMRRAYRGNILTGEVAIGLIAELTSIHELIELIESEAKGAIHGGETGRTGTGS